MSATLIGRDGSVVALNGERTDVAVPIGDYRLGTVTCAFDDKNGGRRWNFVFSDIERRGGDRWYKIEPASSTTIDPIGILDFKTGVEGTEPIRAGGEVRLRPRLYTGDGLLIVTCYRGTVADPAGSAGTGAAITLFTTAGRRLDTARSGFA